MAIYLGIDGGATKTTCVVGNETRILASATSSGSNMVRHGQSRAFASLQDAIRSACTCARVDLSQVARTYIGVAGSSVPDVRDAIHGFVSELVSGDVVVAPDSEIACQAALGDDPGVVVVAGTGSIAHGRNHRGQTARAGGHGFAASDEGSGYWIGRTAISAAFRAMDRTGDTSFLTQLAAAFGGSSRDELVTVANGNPPPDFATLFPVVSRAADAGDVVARTVLLRAGRELAELAAIVIDKLWPTPEPVRVGMIGGVFENSPIVRDEFSRALVALAPTAEVAPDVAQPVLGALALARKGVPSSRTFPGCAPE